MWLARTVKVSETLIRRNYVSIKPEIRWSEQQEMILGYQSRDVGLFSLD